MSFILSHRRPRSYFQYSSGFDSIVDQLFHHNEAVSTKKTSGECAANQEKSYQPLVDISHNAKAYTVNIDLPGVKKDDIHVSVHEGVLSIEGRRVLQKAEPSTAKDEGAEGEVQEQYIRHERKAALFSRSFTLSDDVDETSVEASFVDGVLSLSIAKLVPEEVMPRSISIN